MRETTYLARAAWAYDASTNRSQWLHYPWFQVNEQGTITAIGTRSGDQAPDTSTGTGEVVHDLGHVALLPGLINGHSHAFQRLIRGRTGRRGAGDPSSFWSWRTAMYGEASRLDPESLFAATRACYAEMAHAGITCVGEFHYVHHQADGAVYDDPNALSKAVVAAAKDVGIRLVLLDVYYARAGYQQPLLAEQRRFCDGNIEAYLRRVDDMRTWLAHDDVKLGLAPHSVRAVDRRELSELANYADRWKMVVHAHVSEQERENMECQREHGCTPLALFEDVGLLARPGSFTAVHAIHVNADDLSRLRGHSVCACPTTEADLGDGILAGSQWLGAGAALSLGSDSNAVIDLIQEARLLEMHERLATQSRLVLADSQGAVAPALIQAATEAGAASLGRHELGRLAVGLPFDAAMIDLDHVTLRDVAVTDAFDALMLAGTSAPCVQTWVGGRALALGRHRL